MIRAKYPNYPQLIPSEYKKVFTFDTKILTDSLDRIAILAGQEIGSGNMLVKIKMNQNGQALISADAKDIGSANESIPVVFDCESLDIAFNVRYLLEGLKVISSQKVLLKCNDPITPAILVPEDNKDSFTYLVMPVQVGS